MSGLSETPDKPWSPWNPIWAIQLDVVDEMIKVLGEENPNMLRRLGDAINEIAVVRTSPYQARQDLQTFMTRHDYSLKTKARREELRRDLGKQKDYLEQLENAPHPGGPAFLSADIYNAINERHHARRLKKIASA